ncbi:transposase [Patescibacteria group bacterium]|nr:transposase [Patescibacteria group bacterium]
MINIGRALKNERLTSALTGLRPQEFLDLLPAFSEAWQKSKRHKNRKRKIGGGRIGFLRTIPEKLFFILFYYKCYPTYDVMSFFYGCNRANTFRRQRQLSGILEATLGKKLVLPKRQMRSVEDFLKAFPEAREVFIDGTERPIQRPKDKEKQKANYSGKKKRHTRKNLVIAEKNKGVGFLSKTVEGKERDFTLLKEQAPPEFIPKKIKKHLDLGFQGFDNQFPGHIISMPQRKTKNKKLSNKAINKNKKKSGIRVLVEHAIGGVKRLRIVTDVFRNRVEGFDDQAILISCGLWNYHLASSR